MTTERENELAKFTALRSRIFEAITREREARREEREERARPPNSRNHRSSGNLRS